MRSRSAARAHRRIFGRVARGACASLRPLVLTVLAFGQAQASPLDDAHVGGIGWGGPTNDDLSAIYWNPAALGLRVGTRAMVVLGGQRGSHTVSRDPIDPTTGAPGGNRGFGTVVGRADRMPTSFPFGPGSFVASSQSVGSRVTFAAAVYTPFATKLGFGNNPAGEQPARYHVVDTDVSSVALAPGLAVRLGGGVRIGLAPTFMLSRGDMSFDHDTGSPSGSAGAARLCDGVPCGAENPATAARYQLGADTSLFDSAFSITLGMGIHLQRPTWSAGAAFVSSPLGGDHGVELDARTTRIDLPPRLQAGATLCPPGQDPCVTSRITYRLPMMATVGVQRQILPWLALVVQGRWLDLSAHDTVRVRLVGPAGGALRTAGVPDLVVMHRGLQDTFDLRLRALMRLHDAIELSATVRGETAATSTRALSPATMGGALIEPAVAVRMRINDWLSLGAGYAVAVSPTTASAGTLDDPGANAACEAAGEDLANAACQKRQHGLARPSASGRYRALMQSFSVVLQIQRLPR